MSECVAIAVRVLCDMRDTADGQLFIGSDLNFMKDNICTKCIPIIFIYLYIQHLLSAIYTSKDALMRYLKRYIYIYTVIIIVDRILLLMEIYYILGCMQIS